VLVPQVIARALYDWLTIFGIRCLQRHNAMADALATAELLLRLWPLLRREGATGIEAASRLARQRRWMSGV
jgi:DNA polymerase-3 subunit epsilon